MSSINIAGDTSGSVILTVPAAAGSSTITLPAGTGTVAVQGVSTNIVSGTAQASTSGTAILFSNIPSWVKRITVMFASVGSNGSSAYLVQIGSGSITTTGYVSQGNAYNTTSGTAGASSTAGFLIHKASSADSCSGSMVLNIVSGNTWISSSNGRRTTNDVWNGGGVVTLSGILDRVNITTVNGTDTFNAGTINIMYE